MEELTLVLASSSPRRHRLIQLVKMPYRIQAADVDESSVDHSDPAMNVAQTASLKSAYVSKRSGLNKVIIGADTTVALDGRMLNKPANELEAKEMLMALRGRTHQVHTGISLVDNATGRSVVDVCTVDVPMRRYDAFEVDAYISTGDPLDKAGAYAIQHPDFQPVEGLSGCFAAVVGLPLCHLVRSLRHLGTTVDADVPAACQKHHDYQCDVFESIHDTRPMHL